MSTTEETVQFSCEICTPEDYPTEGEALEGRYSMRFGHDGTTFNVILDGENVTKLTYEFVVGDPGVVYMIEQPAMRCTVCMDTPRHYIVSGKVEIEYLSK